MQSSTKPVRLLHLTDPHLFAGEHSRLRGSVPHETYSQVIADIAQRNWPAEAIIATGDIVQDGTKQAYDRFRTLTGVLGLPVHCVPGNHDKRKRMRKRLSKPPFTYCETVILGDWEIIGIDSCEKAKASGRIADSELERLSQLVNEPSAPHQAICLHHPATEVSCEWLNRVGLYNADELFAIIKNSSVRAIFSGHIHQPLDTVKQGIQLIGTPSTCRQFKPDSASFALDDSPPSYRQVTLNPDGSIDSKLIQVDKGR